jgi:hypothetical protein
VLAYVGAARAQPAPAPPGEAKAAGLVGGFSDEATLPPPTANLTAYRPQRGGGYAPFLRTAVAEQDEDDAELGPGIRLNVPGDNDPAGEDDLIEVRLDVNPPGAQVVLRRGDAALAVWLTRNKAPGTQIAFSGDATGALPIGPPETTLTLWVEWASSSHGVAELRVAPLHANQALDTLIFHTFGSIVIALGGENQTPSDPPDPATGTFVVAKALYTMGYDVHMYDEDNVAPDGSGSVYNEIATAVQHRGVGEIAIFGYSHGGGATYNLSNRLDFDRPGLGVFEISFTSYVDSVRATSDIDTAQELRRPPSTVYHLNQYQHGVFLEDFGLDGGPVPDSHPPPTGLDVETTPWGAGCDHFEVDDFLQVRMLIEQELETWVSNP